KQSKKLELGFGGEKAHEKEKSPRAKVFA
ncbi:hypothetical protein A2U01_0114697, partial [Trifolium medium]|nr:hypothetical protein [Trifolium medium]